MAHFSQAVDTYAFGIIMWETLERLEPWSNMGFKWSHEILDAVCDGKRPPYSKENHQEAPAGFVELMTTCWAQSPDKRPQFNWVIRGLQDVQSAWHARQRQRMAV